MSASEMRQIMDSEPAVREFESLVRRLSASYTELLELAERRLAAIRTADTEGLASCIARENEIVQQVAELEKERIRVVGALAGRLQSTTGVNTTFTWIGERITGATGERIVSMATELRGRIERLKRINAAGAMAAETLVTHMQGLMRQVAGRLNHARTYARSGSVEAGPAIVSSLDMTS